MTDLDDIVSNFELLDDWEQRYAYIVEMGESLPDMPDRLKIDENKVHGCMSQVWVSAYTRPNDTDHVYFYGDCDTSIIKGVLAILIQLCNEKTAEEIRQLDVDEFFERLQLYDHLSPNRHVGVYAIVALMKRQALKLYENQVDKLNAEAIYT